MNINLTIGVFSISGDLNPCKDDISSNNFTYYIVAI